MNLTSIAFRFDRVIYVLTTLLVLSGISAYFDLPKAQDPGFTIRTAVITTHFPGASPERVEQLVTDKIEKVVQELPELDNVTSQSLNGISTIYINIKEKYRDMRPIFDTLRRKVEAINDLPKGIQGPFINDEFGDVFGMLYAISGPGFNYSELKTYTDDVRSQLLKVAAISKVEIQGAQDEVIYVEYNNARLTELGLSPQQLSNSLSSANILQPGGAILIGQERISLEPSGNFDSLDDIRRTVVQLPNRDDVVYLDDIAKIYRGYTDPAKSKARFNGKPVLVLSISMQEGGNILELGEILEKRIPELESNYPWGIQIKPIFFQPAMVADSVNNFMINLMQAVTIVMLVMVAFLGFRIGFLVSLLIPMTIAVSFLLMQMFDITINQISLAALIIALGLLVDNAIVIVETILVRQEKGEDAISAAIASGKELAVPLLISSLTTAAAFLSIFLAESTVGEYTADIFKVNTIALLSSWVLAMTIIPLLSKKIIRISSKPSEESYQGLLYSGYRKILIPALKNKTIFLLTVMVFFVCAIYGLKLVPKVFIPPTTNPIINAKFNMPRGTAIETTEAVLTDIESFMQQQLMVTEQEKNEGKQGLTHWVSFVGKGTPRYSLSANPEPLNSFHTSMILTTTDQYIIPEMIEKIQQYTFQNHPDLKVQLKKLENGAPIEFPISIRISGNDFNGLYQIIEPIKTKLLSLAGVLDVEDDWGARSKKLSININQDQARRAKVSSEDVAISLQASLSGLELTQYREQDKLIPVTLRSVVADRQDIGKLDGMSVYSQSSGETVPLKQIADVNIAWQYSIIKRKDRERTITINAQLQPGITASEINAPFNLWLADYAKNWDYGYNYELGGEAETSGDASKSISDKLAISGIIIVLLLVGQFNSIRKPLIILTTIPLGIIGVTVGLLVANSIFGFFTILGIISLSGIIINNAIVLIDRIQIELENGRDELQAIIVATHQRLRPILLTTATTIGGMLPLWLSHDPMFETMAVSIIFGLAFATLLTLVLVPVLFSLFFRVDFKQYEYSDD
ncbi:MAG: efflux RND transporter permease subunit [Methylococcaceae bacterium]|nr:efflux RND transporter permease subunit [Methylococcaceae bacterium]